MRKLSLFVACLLAVACSPTDEPSAEVASLPPAYAGAISCSGCHESEFNLWRNSHHALAMQHATPESVLGDFSNVDFQQFETTSTFFRRDDQFLVRTDNAGGALQDYRVAYTFGVEPLQQYLIEFPGGRLQSLPIAWDTRPAEDGGQRWFHLYPDEPIKHDDPLHWTGREQNWNTMCAECHSTNIAKNYSVESDSFDTTWSEINVSCEACHGPASHHVAQAEAADFDNLFGLIIDLDDTGRTAWEMRSDTGIAARSELRMRAPAQPEACGRCHARRSVASAEYEFGKSLLDTHSPVLLDDRLYFPDGQIHAEVYVYGSFLQSRMYQAGVSCSDCHEPHSGALRTGSDPSDICSTCHLPARFAGSEHHNHPRDSVVCVDCHMPSRNYMVVDGRRDHSFRLPNADLTVATGSPNACNQCHSDKTAEWTASTLLSWYGEKNGNHFGFSIHAARIGEVGANGRLIEVINDLRIPGIARGTALTELQAPFSQDIGRTIQTGLADSDPFVRVGALRALAGLPPELQMEWATPLLRDRLLAVRLEAMRVVSPFRNEIDLRDKNAFDNAERELIESMQAIAELPDSHGNLGNNYVDAGNLDLALTEYQMALRLDSRAVRPRANLADLYRRLDRDSDAEALLRDGISLVPDEAALHHSLGLLLVRASRHEEGLDELRRAAELQDGDARYLYVYAVALNSIGQPDEAIGLLLSGRDRFPADFDIQWALATMLRDQGNNVAAKEVAEDLAERYPGLPPLQNLLHSL